MIELTSLKFIKHYINYKLKLYILKIKFKLLLLYMMYQYQLKKRGDL